MGVSWRDIVTNERALQRVGKKREVLNIGKRIQLENLGYIMRKPKVRFATNNNPGHNTRKENFRNVQAQKFAIVVH